MSNEEMNRRAALIEVLTRQPEGTETLYQGPGGADVRVKWRHLPFGVQWLASITGEVWHADPDLFKAIEKARTLPGTFGGD